MLGELISMMTTVGITLTLSGVAVVLLEKEYAEGDPISKRLKTWGVFLALVGAVGQGFGLVFAKEGMYLNPNMVINPLSATLMRMMLGALFVWMCAPFAGKLLDLRRALKSKEGIRNTAVGASVGPFMGVTFSMVAVAYTEAGIAQTLMSLMPVIIIPVVWVLHRQRTSWRGIFGAVVAVIGVAILFLA